MEEQHFEDKLGTEMFKVAKKFMLLLGSWRINNANTSILLLYRIYYFICTSIFMFASILSTVKLMDLLYKANEMNLVVDQVGKVTLAIILIIKTRIYGGERMADIIQTGIRDTNEAIKLNLDIRNIVLETVTYCNRTNFIIAGLTIVAGSLYNLNIIIEAYHFEKRYNFSMRPAYLLASYYPYENYFYLVFTGEICLATYIILLTCSYQTLLISIMNNAVAQIRIIHYYFKCFGNNKVTELTENLLQKKLKNILIMHQKLISDMDYLNESINIAIFIEYVVSSLMIASMILQFINGVHISYYAAMLVQVSFQLLLFGYCADEIKSLSEELSTTIYSTNWYKQSTTIKRLLFIAMMRSNKPIVLTIGPFGAMSKESVIAIFKMAYSYVSLLSRGK